MMKERKGREKEKKDLVKFLRTSGSAWRVNCSSMVLKSCADPNSIKGFKWGAFFNRASFVIAFFSPRHDQKRELMIEDRKIEETDLRLHKRRLRGNERQIA